MGAWRGVSPLHKARCVCKDVNLVFALSLSTCPTQLPTVLTSFWPYVFIFWTPLATPLSPELRNWRKSSIPVPSPALKWPIFTSCFLCFMSRVFVCTCICFFSQKFTNCWSGLLFFFLKVYLILQACSMVFDHTAACGLTEGSTVTSKPRCESGDVPGNYFLTIHKLYIYGINYLSILDVRSLLRNMAVFRSQRSLINYILNQKRNAA